MLDHLGFGFAEIGSISARPSVGNPGARLFRLPEDRAIIVNYGLPNDGAEIIAQRLADYRSRIPIGVNIVKTNDGPAAPMCSEDRILEDYERSVSLTHRHANYLTLNLSCPNAKGGTEHFGITGSIRRLLKSIASIQINCPVFLKLAPTANPAALDQMLLEVEPFEFVKGFIFNLPSGKPDTLQLNTPRSSLASMPGAVAGKPVEALINSCIQELYRRMPCERYTIIGAGGVFSAEDAYEKICSGASLVQIYSAMIYEGPGITQRINRGLLALLQRGGFERLSDAVGTNVK